jgi:hypothetical protein
LPLVDEVVAAAVEGSSGDVVLGGRDSLMYVAGW